MQAGYSAAERKRLVQKDEGGLWYTTKDQLWVPELQPREGSSPERHHFLRPRLLVIAHMGAAGHRGEQATWTALFQKFWWPKLREDVQVFVRDCIQCVKVAGGRVIPRPLGEQIKAEKPNEVLHFDFLYMGEGEGGFEYLLVIKDAFFQMVELIPSAAATARVCADALLMWFVMVW